MSDNGNPYCVYGDHGTMPFHETSEHVAPVNAACPDCGWTMPADDAEEAAILLAIHRVVKATDAAESIVEDEAGRDG